MPTQTNHTAVDSKPTPAPAASGLKIKTHIKAGLMCQYCMGNHNETQVPAPKPAPAPAASGLKIKTHIKAGLICQYCMANHNESQLPAG